MGERLTYHKEKMLLCKQAEKGVPLQAEQADWLEDTNEEFDEQELEAHYMEKDDSNVTLDSPDMYDNDIQTDQNAEDERVMLAYLIANLKLDVDEKPPKAQHSIVDSTIFKINVPVKKAQSEKAMFSIDDIPNANQILQTASTPICMYRIDTRTTQTRAPQLPQTSRNINLRVSTSTGVIYKTTVSRPQLRITQMKDKVVPNNSHIKDKKTEVEEHPRISSISNKTKFVTACNDSLKSRTSNVNSVCATCEKCMFNSNHDAYVSKFLNDVNARTKKPNIVPISTRKPKSQANKSIATHPKKLVALESTIQNSKSYYRMLYEKTSKA
ncbi:hypothetical protein Tco_0565660 [Tanacetum coccineum]